MENNEEFNYSAGEKYENLQKSRILNMYGVNIEKGGKAATIGEIRTWNGKKYKKQVNGKWLEVSESGMSKKEHETQAYSKNTIYTHLGKTDREKDQALKEYSKHKKESSELSDKEHSDEEVGLDNKPEKKQSNDQLVEEIRNFAFKAKVNGKKYDKKEYARLKGGENVKLESIEDVETLNKIKSLFERASQGLKPEHSQETKLAKQKDKENMASQRKYTEEVIR